MTAFYKIKVGLALCCFVVAAGCAQKEGPASVATDSSVAISCIAVMPVQPSVDFEDILSPAEKKTLKDGSLVMDGLLKQFLTGKANVRFVAEGQSAGKKTEGGTNGLVNARRVADQLKCNAALETNLNQYADRVGGPYGAKESAAVTFTYRLYETGSGKVICHGRFDEKQQSVMDNLLTLPKAQSRGMTWLTAEELLREGVKERLGQCAYLEGK